MDAVSTKLGGTGSLYHSAALWPSSWSTDERHHHATNPTMGPRDKTVPPPNPLVATHLTRPFKYLSTLNCVSSQRRSTVLHSRADAVHSVDVTDLFPIHGTKVTLIVF